MIKYILKKSCFCTDGKISVRINLPLFSTVLPSSIFMFLSCRPFVVITTLTGLVGVEVTSVSWPKGLQDRNINILAGTTVENKGKLILTEHISQPYSSHFITHKTC